MARYDRLRKIERNKAVKQYAQEHPELSAKEIGEHFGVSGSRIWYILHDNKHLPKNKD